MCMISLNQTFKVYSEPILQKLQFVAGFFQEILCKNNYFLQLDLGGCFPAICKFPLR